MGLFTLDMCMLWCVAALQECMLWCMHLQYHHTHQECML